MQALKHKTEKKILRMEYTCSIFQDYPYVLNNAKLFIQDFHNFLQPPTRRRLQMSVNPYFIGKPYFSEAVSQAILAIAFESDTLKGKIEKLQEENYSSYCLAPILLRAFGLQEANVMENLELEEFREPQENGRKEGATMRILKRKFLKLSVKDR